MRLVAIVLMAAPLLAQSREVRGEPAEPPARGVEARQLGDDLSRAKLELQRNQADEDRLLTLRIRHELGLPVDNGVPFALQEGERALSPEGGEAALRAEEGKLRDLTERLEVAQRKLQSERTRHPRVGEPYAPEPTLRERRLAAARGPDRPRPEEGTRREPAKAAERTASRPSEPRGERPREQLLISGSTDRRTVGRILFKAGRFKEAREELEEAVHGEAPELQDLFFLAQCWERLQEPAKADDLYARIEALDTKETLQGKVLGPWAEAARAAKRQMNWMVENGDWKLPRTIDSIEWRKKRP